MKKLFAIAMSIVLVAMAVWLVGCAKEDSNTLVPAAGPKNGGEQIFGGKGQNGTTLQDQYVTINCYNACTWDFSITTVDPTLITLDRTECADVTVGVEGSKACSSGFKGQVCGILNGGAVATENLKITVTLLQNCGGGTGYVAVAGPFTVDVSSNPILDPNEIGCYDYDIPYAIDPSCTYKVNADIRITNHSGHLGEPFGPSPDSPSIPGCSPEDECATVSLACPEFLDMLGGVASGFDCSVVPDSYYWDSESNTGSFTVHICNNAAPCEETFNANLCATLVTCDKHITMTDCKPAAFQIVTPPCGGDGCTHTIGYWKTHAVDNLYGHNTDHVSAYLPIKMGSLTVSTNYEVVNVMKRIGPGGSSNGILKLYAQMLGALLSKADGADASCIETALTDANNFLMTHTADSWASLTKDERNLVLGWQSMFDQYNNGLLCTPHCD